MGPWQVAAVQGRAGGHGVNQRTNEVVVQPPGLQQPKGLVGQGLGLGPVLASDRHQAAFGQAARRAVQDPGAGAQLDRLSQDRICLVGVAVIMYAPRGG